MPKILFICTGNICRSPTAEAVFRHIVTRQGYVDNVIIDSAGTHGYHVGEPPDSRAVDAAKARGISMNGLFARKISPKDFELFSLILALDSGHYDILARSKPEKAPAKLAMLMDFAPGSGVRDVPDPYYGGPADFRAALDLIEQGAEGLFKALKNNEIS